MNKLLLGLSSSIFFWLIETAIVQAQPPETIPEKELNQAQITFSPLREQLLFQPTAKHLGKGEVFINLDTRTFFFPDLVDEAVDDSDSAVNFNTGFSWGITDELQLTLQFQHVDSSTPIKQGEFTSERTEDNEAAVELKYRLWNNQAETQALSGIIAASWGTRGFMFTRGEEVTEINNRDIFVSLAVPLTTDVGDRWQFNLAPTVAFFRDESAVFFHRLPDDDESSFGTVLGLGGGFSYQVNPKLYIFSDVFLPLTGNNSINRDSGKPDQAIAYNAGLRYLTNPQLAFDLYASNTFASFAPLSLTADRDFLGLGAKIVFLPDIFPANRRYRESSVGTSDDIGFHTTDGLAYFDGGTLPSGKFAFNLQGGNQGVLTALRFGLLKDFEAGIFLDYVSGEVDESEQGISGKIRFLNQAENDPVTLSAAITGSLTNEPFINFRENDTSTFERLDLDKSIPFFTPGGDDGLEGKLLIFTLSFPLHYQISRDTAVWLTPIAGYVQREGLEIGGFNLGGAIALKPEISVVGEIGANFVGDGNSFIDGQRENRIPWTVSLRWTPLTLLNRKPSSTNSDPYLELYLTNRVGFSTWHQLRVREDNNVGIGVGLSVPF